MSNIDANTSLIRNQPSGSKVKLTNTKGILEITMPPRGLYFGLLDRAILIASYGYCICCYFRPVYISIFGDFLTFLLNPIGWVVLILFGAPLYISLEMIWTILFALAGVKKFRITNSNISLSSTIFGLKYKPSPTASRQQITKINLTEIVHLQIGDGGTPEISSQINIWAGDKTFKFGYSLTEQEVRWLMREFNNWLYLPDEVKGNTW